MGGGGGGGQERSGSRARGLQGHGEPVQGVKSQPPRPSSTVGLRLDALDGSEGSSWTLGAFVSVIGTA